MAENCEECYGGCWMLGTSTVYTIFSLLIDFTLTWCSKPFKGKKDSLIFVNLFFFSTCRKLSSFVAVVFCKWGFMHFCLTSSFYDTLTFSENDYLLSYTVWGLLIYIKLWAQISALCLCNASIRETWSMWEHYPFKTLS